MPEHAALLSKLQPVEPSKDDAVIGYQINVSQLAQVLQNCTRHAPCHTVCVHILIMRVFMSISSMLSHLTR